ncbi:HAD family hydrolase [Nonomuraea sp. NPDC050328]|uniref:HAD family hydrolase n=1 Tax=Nonomuraea sp. NPDC050328 TaxID=3364361 RepID=UPI0037ABF191
MSAAPIRWIVTDLDGTLVGRDLAMVPSGREALRRFRAAGGEVVIATGRRERSARRFYEELELDGPAILYNGARTVNLATGEILSSHHLPAAAWKALLDVFARLPRGVSPVVFSGGVPYALEETPELRDYARRDGIELSAPGEWTALRDLAAARGVPLAEIAAVGDNPNDLDLILAAGLGVAVGDGHPEVRASAAVVVRACADGAVADVVELALRGRA